MIFVSSYLYQEVQNIKGLRIQDSTVNITTGNDFQKLTAGVTT